MFELTNEAVLWVLSGLMFIGILRLEWIIHKVKLMDYVNTMNFTSIAAIMIKNKMDISSTNVTNIQEIKEAFNGKDNDKG